MKSQVYSREEFIKKLNITQADLKGWEDTKIISPSGFTDDSISFYSDESVEQARRIIQLLDFGYGLPEIQKIIKKVGLPSLSPDNMKNREPKNYLTVGGLADRVGISPRTIKHWEDKGIIEPDSRSDGGFRLYAEHYVFFCKLIRDLQLFGYALDEIKMISDLFRDFIRISNDPDSFSEKEMDARLDKMLREITLLFKKMEQFKEGIQRWETLARKKKKEILQLKSQNQRRITQKTRVKEELINA